MQTLLLCMALILSLPVVAGEKTPKILIDEYESASSPKQPQALRNLLNLAPSKFSQEEFKAIAVIVKGLYTKKSTLLGEVPQPWQEALVANDPTFHTVFPKIKVVRSPHKHPATSAAADEKRSAAASSSAAAAPTKQPQPSPLPAAQLQEPFYDEELVNKFWKVSSKSSRDAQALAFFRAHPKAINLMLETQIMAKTVLIHL